MQSNKTCPLVEQYLSYLVVIKGRNILLPLALILSPYLPIN